MTVTTVIPPSLRPWSGYAEPGFPVAVWWAFAEVIGDASGGRRELQVVFKSANQPGQPRLYNLEQFDYFDNDNIARLVDLIWQGFDLPPGTDSGGVATGGGGLAFVSVPSVVAGALLGTVDMLKLPFLLGLPAAFLSQSTFFLRTPNVDLASVRMKVSGYVWDARSFQVPGGPRRPPGALWG